MQPSPPQRRRRWRGGAATRIDEWFNISKHTYDHTVGGKLADSAVLTNPYTGQPRDYRDWNPILPER